jgi:hypothetical protein
MSLPLQWASREFAGMARLASSTRHAQQQPPEKQVVDHAAGDSAEQRTENRGSWMSHQFLLKGTQRLQAY